MALDMERVRGPAHHGSTLFRREFYERVGGYREQFYFAQDLDLWTRLVEHGRHIALPDVLYQASFALGSISGQCSGRRQIACAKIILECARLRRAGLDEAPVVAKAAAIVPARRGTQGLPTGLPPCISSECACASEPTPGRGNTSETRCARIPCT